MVNYRFFLGFLPVLVLSLLLGGCSCEGSSTSKLDPELRLDLQEDPTGLAAYLLDFGLVPIGSEAIREFSLQNVGSSPLSLSTHAPEPPFGLSIPGGEGPLTVGIGASEILSFSFTPTKASEKPSQAIVTFSTNERGEARTHTIRLEGRGVEPRLDCDPDPLDFDRVIRGGTKTKHLSCVNATEAPLLVTIEGFRGNARSYFSVSVEKDPEGRGPFEVPPGESLKLEISFRAEFVGKNDATLVLRGEGEQLLAQPAMVAEAMASALQVEPTSCLEFDYVGVGERRQRPLHARNIGNVALEIQAVRFAGEGASHFSMVTQPPISLAPGGEESTELMIEFHPLEGGKLTTTVELVAVDSQGDEVVANGCVSGFGGGPKLACHPTSMDFGMAAVGMSARRSFDCVNDGYTPSGVEVDPLIVLAIGSDNPLFSAQIRNPDGTSGPKPEGYEIGDGFIVDVTYSPEDESFDTGTIVLESIAASGGSLDVGVSGQGRALPPCDFSIEPPELRFGVVDKGGELELTFGIVNQRESACLIHELKLSDDSDPAFFVDKVSSYELEGNQTLRVPVVFAPTAHAPAVSGRVVFQISDPAAPDQEVLLSGSSAEACLAVEPEVLDFGKAEPGCRSRDRRLIVTNVCRNQVEISAVELSETLDSRHFHVTQRPSLPAVLRQRDRVEVYVAFVPTEFGSFSSAISIETAARGTEAGQLYISPMIAEGKSGVEQTDTFEQREQPKVDILWVMDNSGSFDPFQERIAENLPSFIEYANQQGIDWHMAVTTTGLVPSGNCPGGANGGEDGRFFPVDGSHPRILDRRTQNLDTHWRNNMLVGTCHADELPYEAAKRALSEPLISSEKDARYPNSGYMDGNAGFLRNDADLSIIFVTDEVDHSPDTPANYLNFFRSIKGPRSSRELRIHAITGPKEKEGWLNCPPVEYGDRLLYSVDETGGTWLNICTPTNDNEAWGAGLRKMSEAAFGFVTRFVLRGEPVSKTNSPRVTERDIVLKVNGKVIDPMVGANKAWTYDPIANAIDFTHFYTPPAGSQVSATYDLRCIQ